MTDTTITLTISGSAAVIAQALAAISGTDETVSVTLPPEKIEPLPVLTGDGSGVALPPATDQYNYVQPVEQPVMPIPAATVPPVPEVDADGVAWDASLHTATKTKTADGKWRKRRGAGGVEQPAAAPAAAIPPMPLGDNAPVPAAASTLPLPAPGVPPVPLPVNVTPLLQSQPTTNVSLGTGAVPGTPPALPVGAPTAAPQPKDFITLLLPAINASKAAGAPVTVGELMTEVGAMIGIEGLDSPARITSYPDMAQVAFDTLRHVLASRGLPA